MHDLRRLAAALRPARWVDLAGGLATPYLADLLATPSGPRGRRRARPLPRPLILDVAAPSAAALDHVLPLQLDRGGRLRLLSAAELEAYRARVRAFAGAFRRADLLDRAATLRAAAPAPRRGPTLWTNGGLYLGSPRPHSRALRAAAIAAGLSPIRAGTLGLLDTFLALLRAGDVLALFGGAAIPYFRGVSWLTLHAYRAPGGALRLHVRAIGYRGVYPSRPLEWAFRLTPTRSSPAASRRRRTPRG
jgi:hypothetical protein